MQSLCKYLKEDRYRQNVFFLELQTHDHVMPCFMNSTWVLFGKDYIILTRSIKRLTLSTPLFVRDFPTLHKPSPFCTVHYVPLLALLLKRSEVTEIVLPLIKKYILLITTSSSYGFIYVQFTQTVAIRLRSLTNRHTGCRIVR